MLVHFVEVSVTVGRVHNITLGTHDAVRKFESVRPVAVYCRGVTVNSVNCSGSECVGSVNCRKRKSFSSVNCRKRESVSSVNCRKRESVNSVTEYSSGRGGWGGGGVGRGGGR